MLKGVQMKLEKELSGENIVYLLVYRFYDYKGEKLTYGGVQRYTDDLTKLLESQGCKCIVLQKAAKSFEIKYREQTTVIGVKCSKYFYGDPIFNYMAHRRIPKGAPVIYVSMQLAFPIIRHPSVIIQHGVWWDGKFGYLKSASTRFLIKNMVKRTDFLICVDTNFINWFRATWPWIDINQKVKFVPNYADNKLFYDDVQKECQDKIKVLFPRRIETYRGTFLLLNVIDKLISDYPNIEFHFVGDGSKRNEVESFIINKNLQTHVKLYSLSFQEMPDAYHGSDIVVIPTIYSEGTSLSCIEAMHSGKAIIVTNVGGLTNLILNTYNGLMINPNEEELYRALKSLIDNPNLRRILGSNAKRTAENLNLDSWKKEIGEVFERLFFRT